MKNKLNNLTVIIPVHTVSDENFKEMFSSALDSIQANDTIPNEVIIVRCMCDEVKNVLESFDYKPYTFNVRVIENKTNKTFQEQINYAAKRVNTEYFTFLEFDDTFSVIWFRNLKKYMDAYPDVDMFLPIIYDESPTKKFLGYTNEAAWAYNFSEKLGYIDHEVLLEYANINPDGMVVKTKKFIDSGMYKPSINFTFNYEFLLRFTKNNNSIMVIPKIGYKHVNMRENSLFWNYKNNPIESERITPKDAEFWMSTAKSEFHFLEDRKINIPASHE